MYFIGIDVSKKTSHYFVTDEQGIRVVAGKAENSKESFQNLVSGLVREKVKVALEAGNISFQAARWLKEAGAEVVIVNPYKNALIRETAQKTDLRDARQLCDQLRKDQLPPEPVFLPAEATEDLRRLIHYRASLVKKKTATTNLTLRIAERHGLLFNKNGLDSFRAWSELAIKASNWNEVDKYMFCLQYKQTQFLTEEVRHCEKRIEEMSRRLFKEPVALLRTIPGIGPLTAAIIVAYVERIDRFKSARHLCSYFGLIPRIRQSGMQTGTGLRITKQGNALARGYLIQASFGASLKLLQDAPLRNWHQEIRKRKGSAKARVALARKLLSTAYGVWAHKTPYDPQRMTAAAL